MPLAEMQLQRDRERELKQALWQIRDAIDAYHHVAKQATNAGGAATGVIRGRRAPVNTPPQNGAKDY